MADTATTKAPEAETPVKDQALTLLRERVEFLRPLASEYSDLSTMLSRIEASDNGNAPAERQPRQQPQQRRTSNDGGEPSGRPGEFLKIVRENPGIAIPDAREKMGLKQPNYLYRIAPQLVEQGLIRKEGKGFVPVS